MRVWSWRPFQLWAWKPPQAVGLETPLRCGPGDPPGVCLETPQGVGLENSPARPLSLPPGCEPGDTPGQTPQLPPGCGPGDPPSQTPQASLWVWAWKFWDTPPSETCKACWDTTCKACWDTTPPPNRITDTCKKHNLPTTSFAGGNKKKRSECIVRNVVLLWSLTETHASNMVNFYALREKIIMMVPYSLTIITVHNSSCGKVMFSQARVKISFHGGDTPSLGRHPPQADTNPSPLRDGHCSGRYASYLNAFCFILFYIYPC